MKDRELDRQNKFISFSSTEEDVFAAAMDTLKKGNAYLTFFDKDDMKSHRAIIGFRVINRIIDEGLFPFDKVITVCASPYIVQLTQDAIANDYNPPWYEMAIELCPKAKLFAVIRDYSMPNDEAMLSVGWDDPRVAYDAPAQVQ